MSLLINITQAQIDANRTEIDGKILKLVPVVEAVPAKVAKPVKAEKAE